MTMKKIKEKRAQLQADREKWFTYKFLPVDVINSSEYETILNASASAISNIVITKQHSAEFIMRIFCHSAWEAHLRCNCLTEIMFDRGIRLAKELDREYEATGKIRGKLHGIPISLKDHFMVRGYDATSGYSKFALDPCTTNTPFLDILEEQGAIAYCKTNVPQTLMTFECTNPLFGRTNNPHNASLSPGGSSGGEAALLACRGSCLGVGGDIAGSLRIPAMYCGIYALKSSPGRLPLLGHKTGMDGQSHILPTLGPMARNIEDLELFMQAAIGAQPHKRDPSALYYEPWTPFSFKKNVLRIGYYTSDGFLQAAPACVRAVEETVEALKLAGHELVPFTVPNSLEGCKMFYQWAGADGLKTYKASLGSDPLDPSMRDIFAAYGLPMFLKNFIAFILRLFGQSRAAELLPSMNEVSVQKLYELQHQQICYAFAFAEYWKSLDIDFLIAPGFGCPATPHGAFSDLSINGWYTAIFNAVHFSVGAMPVSSFDKELDGISDEMKSFDMIDKVRFSHYDVDQLHGLPLGVQVVGGYRQEERTIAAMKIVQQCLNKMKGQQ